MNDNGYDVADYYKINPQFGTMEDMEQLIEKNKTTPVHPSEFKDALKALKDAKEGLTFVPVAPVSKEVLSGLIICLRRMWRN